MRKEGVSWASLALLLAVGAGCASLPGGGSLKSLEDALVFHPARFPAGDWHGGSVIHEDAWFKADDGTALHGWFCPIADPRAVVLYCHGNAGNITHLQYPIALLQQCGASVFVFDYRGYGKSEGKASEAGLLMDARAARRWLAQRVGVPEPEIVLVGRSLGGAVAVDLAANDGARGLVLENTLSSLPDIARSHPATWSSASLVTARWGSSGKIAKYNGPLLQTHGDKDEVIPLQLGNALYAAANEPKQFILAAGGGHNSMPTPQYCQALRQFLENLPNPRPAE